PAVALISMQYERAFSFHMKIDGEILTARLDRQFRNSVACRRHRPVAAPGPERLDGNSGLTDAATCDPFGDAAGVRCRHRRMRPPDLLVRPSLTLRPGFEGLPEQCPLGAMDTPVLAFERGGQVPPLDAEFRMRTVIAGKDESRGLRDFREVRRRLA